MRDPGAVVAGVRLAAFVLGDFRHGARVGLGIVLDRDLRGHAAHGVDAAPVTRLDQQVRVRLQEAPRHRDQRAVGQDAIRTLPEFLDEAEDVVPASAIQAGRMVAQLPEDLVHLEGCEDRLDEDRRADRPGRELQLLLRGAEDVVPEPRLQMALHLGKVEVGPGPAREQAARVVKEVKTEVEEARRDRPAIDAQVRLVEMPAARADHERRDMLVQAVGLALGRDELDRALDRVAQVALALDEVLPGRRAGVLEVGHEHVRAGVERVDDHLPIHGARDLDPAVLQVRRDRRRRPGAAAHGGGLGQEVGLPAGVEIRLHLATPIEQGAAAGSEPALQHRDEL